MHLFEVDFHVGRLVGRGVGVGRPLVGVLGGFVPGVFQLAGLGAAAPQVLIGAVFVVGRSDGQVALAGVLHLVLAVHAPLPDGGDDFHALGEGGHADLDANLVVALAGAAVGDGLGAVFNGNLGEAAGDEGAAQGGGQGILTLVNGAGPERRPQELADQRLATIDGNGLGCSDGIGALADGFQVHHAQVDGAGDDVGVVVFLQPGHGDRGVKAAGVGEDYFLAGHWAGALLIDATSIARDSALAPGWAGGVGVLRRA